MNCDKVLKLVIFFQQLNIFLYYKYKHLDTIAFFLDFFPFLFIAAIYELLLELCKVCCYIGVECTRLKCLLSELKFGLYNLHTQRALHARPYFHSNAGLSLPDTSIKHYAATL